jgi:hypothetical protein
LENVGESWKDLGDGWVEEDFLETEIFRFETKRYLGMFKFDSNVF